MNIIQLPLVECLNVFPECKSLSHGQYGGMGTLFEHASLRTLHHIQTFVALVDEKPVRWAWAIPGKIDGKQSFISFFFVNKADRKNKVGFALYKSVRKFATSKHRSLWIDSQAKAIKTKNKTCLWASSSTLMDVLKGNSYPRRNW